MVYEPYRENRNWGFKGQICRAAVSISNNIAEGFERKSNIEFTRFLDIARSSNEVRSMSYLAFRLGYIHEDQRGKFLLITDELSKMIYAFMQSLNN